MLQLHIAAVLLWHSLFWLANFIVPNGTSRYNLSAVIFEYAKTLYSFSTECVYNSSSTKYFLVLK